jgi:tetratricopeptide (TPR) repeat protein
MNDGAAAQSRSGGAPPSRSRAGAAGDAQDEQGIADGVAAADVLLTELATERRAHARAERELRDKLAAARAAEKAVLASLRDQTVAAAEAPPGGGWLAPMLRRISSRTAGQLQRFGRKPSVITLADRAQSTGQWQRAALLYRTALDRNPLNPPIWVQYGHALKETGKLAQAEAAYRRAISDEPTVADTHLQLGHVLKRQGRIEEAHAAYLRGCALDPSTPDALHELEGLGWSQTQTAELRGMLGSDDVQCPDERWPKGSAKSAGLRSTTPCMTLTARRSARTSQSLRNRL